MFWLLASGFWFLPSTSAYAGIYSVDSPEIEKGEANIEAGIGLELAPDKKRDHSRKHTLELEYNPTDHIGIGIEAVAKRSSGKGIYYSGTEFESVFQFTKQSQGAPLSTGLLLEYGKEHDGGDADEISARFLLSHSYEKWNVLLNLGGGMEVGSGSSGGISGDIRSRIRYKWSDTFQVSLDYLGDTGDLDKLESFSRQDHRMGPIFYAKVSDNIKATAGYLHGISHHAPDNSFKLLVAYDF